MDKYRIRIIQENGRTCFEHYTIEQVALNRFNDLKMKKQKYYLNMAIYFEELVHKQSQEFKVFGIG